MIPRKIQCLDRLLHITNCLPDILTYLNEEKVATSDETTKVSQASDRASELHILLEQLRKNEKLLLLDYEWTILPVERIRILMVTERSQRSFMFNYT